MKPAVPSLGPFCGRSILFVMATEAEYGPHLRGLIQPVITGVGPVEAAIGTTRALTALLDAGTPPDLVMSLGSAARTASNRAGSIRSRASPIATWMRARWDLRKGATPFLDRPIEIALPIRLHEVPAGGSRPGRISSRAGLCGD